MADAKHVSKQWRVAKYAADGEHLTSGHWSFEKHPVGHLADGEVLIKTHYISCDPTHRIWMRNEDSYMPKQQIGDVMRSLGTGDVVASKNARFPVGQLVVGLTGVQTYAIGNPDRTFLTAINLADLKGVTETDLVDVIGINGYTAYFGALEVGKPKQGETAVVSGASGATGCLAGQILKLKGCRVVGIAGSKEKCDWLLEIGFDEAINYRDYESVEALQKVLAEKCPKGIDVFFDNVGGFVLDAVLPNINKFARVVFCGAISSYNNDYGGPKNYRYFLFKSAIWQGFIVSDYASQFPQATQDLVTWKAQGKLKHKPQHVESGLENYPSVVVKLYEGSNSGKLCIDVRGD